MSMKTKCIAAAALTTLVFATTASAGDLISPVAFVGGNLTASCKIVNVSTADIVVTVQAINADTLAILESSVDVTIVPNGNTSLYADAPTARVFCRFVGAKKTKARASLNIYDPGSADGTDHVVVAAY